MRRSSTRYGAIAFALTAVLSWSEAADAHAFLSRAMPLVGSTISAAPAEMTLDYTEGVETAFSSVAVKDAKGDRVDKNDLHSAPGNQKRILIGLQSLKPGTYSVEWHITSVDAHKTEGSFSFTVAP